MGVIGALGGYGIFVLIYSLFRKSHKGFFIALAVSSWFSIVMGATAAAIELAMSGTSPLVIVLPAMAGVHAIIGIGEAVITTTAVSLILKTRPDLVGCYVPPSPSEAVSQYEKTNSLERGRGGRVEKI